jgi:TRAP-type C4-dicarboxylate transport system permease small subunit
MQGRTGKHSDAPSRTRLPGKFAMSHSAVADVLDRVEGRHAEPRPADAVGRAALATRLLLDTLLSHLGAVWLSAIILVVLGGVVSRYAFNNSFSWTEEAGLWLFTYLIFTALPIATHRSKHIAIPMLRDLLPPGGQAVVRFLAAVAVTYTIIRLLTAGATIAGMTSGSSITLNIPAWWQYAIIPASASLLLLYQVLEGLQVADTRRSGDGRHRRGGAGLAGDRCLGAHRYPEQQSHPAAGSFIRGDAVPGCTGRVLHAVCGIRGERCRGPAAALRPWCTTW